MWPSLWDSSIRNRTFVANQAGSGLPSGGGESVYAWALGGRMADLFKVSGFGKVGSILGKLEV